MATSIVVIVGCVLVAILIGLDVLFASDSVPNNTWSEIIRLWATKTPIIPFACGVLSGHFFHPGTKALLGQPNSIALLIWLACVIGIIGLGLHNYNIMISLWIVFTLGFLGGIFLWPVT